MPDSAPLVQTIERVVAAVAAGADLESDLDAAPFDGTVTSVSYVPSTVLTGANTDSRTINLVNKGQAGAGTTVVASRAFVSGQNIAADDEGAITLSAVAGATTVAAGDVLVWQSNHVGATGLADPGGLARVAISRS